MDTRRLRSESGRFFEQDRSRMNGGSHSSNSAARDDVGDGHERRVEGDDGKRDSGVDENIRESGTMVAYQSDVGGALLMAMIDEKWETMVGESEKVGKEREAIIVEREGSLNLSEEVGAAERAAIFLEREGDQVLTSVGRRRCRRKVVERAKDMEKKDGRGDMAVDMKEKGLDGLTVERPTDMGLNRMGGDTDGGLNGMIAAKEDGNRRHERRWK